MIVIIFLINGTITNDELRMPLSVIPNGVRGPVRRGKIYHSHSE